MTKKNTWFGFECYGVCVENGGVLLDVSIMSDSDADTPVIPCPVCGTPMDFKASWLADSCGYGSRGDGGKDGSRG